MRSQLKVRDQTYLAEHANDKFVVAMIESAYRILKLELIKGHYWFVFPEIKELYKYNGEYWFNQHKGGPEGMMLKADHLHSIPMTELIGTKVKHVAEPEYANGIITGDALFGTRHIGVRWGYIPLVDKNRRRIGYPTYWNEINNLIL